MKKFSCLLVLVCFLVVMSGTALAWSDRQDGRPHHTPAPSISVWQDRSDEFHVKSFNLHGRHVFTGVIRTNGYFFSVDSRDLEGGDYIRVNRDQNAIYFRLTGRGVDEFDFRVRGGGTHVSFDINKDGHPMPRHEIFIGRGGWHPHSHNFQLH